MVFSSLSFLLLFMPAVLLLYYIRTEAGWRNGVLLAASLLFYAWGEPRFLPLMFISSALAYGAGLLLEQELTGQQSKAVLAAGIILCLLPLMIFKYTGFFSETANSLFGLSLNVLSLGLPLGISFYTFQIISYMADVKAGKCRAQKNFFSFLLYVCCFPQLISGPIIRYPDVEARMQERPVSPDEFSSGVRRFITGLAKKVLLANICGAALGELIAPGSGSSMSVGGAWLASFYYTLQLYFDFSSYSDMAIGLGMCFGFTYKENFDYPYISSSVSEFWRRWHISLGSFFRDYVYIPLGGNRRGAYRTCLNMLIVWALTGLWHGAAWNFVLWGAYYGVLLILERFVLKKYLDKIPRFLRCVLTFIIVDIGWVMFRFTDFGLVAQEFAAMFGRDTLTGGAAVLADASLAAVARKYSVFPLLAFVLSLPVGPKLKTLADERLPVRLNRGLTNLGCIIALLLSLTFLVGQSYSQFIYFNF